MRMAMIPIAVTTTAEQTLGDAHHNHSHGHRHDNFHGHGHSHGLVHESIKRSREGLRAVGLALVVLGATAIAQLAAFVASGSVALLADLIHNFGDAATRTQESRRAGARLL